MMEQPSRQQRRALERSAEGVDRATESDRRFFRRFPDRIYRVRAMAPAEIEQLNVVVNGELEPLAPGFRWFILMRQIVPGLRFKVFRQAPVEKVGEDVSEEIARALYDHHMAMNPQARAREAMMRAAIEKAKRDNPEAGAA